MSEFLQVRIEFPVGEDQDDLTSQMLTDSVRSVFREASVGEEAVSTGVDEVSLEKATPLGIDPGTAAVLVALIGMSVELIKLGVDLMKQERELTFKERDERKLLQEFVEKILLARLLERHDIQPTTVTVRIEDR
jgi:hypothetical protein